MDVFVFMCVCVCAVSIHKTHVFSVSSATPTREKKKALRQVIVLSVPSAQNGRIHLFRLNEMANKKRDLSYKSYTLDLCVCVYVVATLIVLGKWHTFDIS